MAGNPAAAPVGASPIPAAAGKPGDGATRGNWGASLASEACGLVCSEAIASKHDG